MYFEKEIPNVYDDDLTDEEEILQWLLSQLEKDEIEDVTDEMLDKLIKEGKSVAVLFCKWKLTPKRWSIVNIVIHSQMTTMTRNRRRF